MPEEVSKLFAAVCKFHPFRTWDLTQNISQLSR